MVKADVKHNYYADLGLPPTCTIDDIKKQYRKLALQYHPDRNAGKEEEYVPKFQAIQTAHEILGDPSTKQKYDADRRKGTLHSGQSFRANQPAPGNPYSANSAYPPPPRRTQPGKWQRPQPFATPASNPGSQPQSSADRFSFPRNAPTARKDPAQERANIFHAWQNMNTAQQRQQQFRPNASAGPQTSPTNSRPPPPSRADTHSRMPTEDEIRAGMNHRKAPSGFDPECAEPKQSAWAAFQQTNNAKSGVNRSKTTNTKTPRKQGFDPNVPGSDERPAGTGAYVHSMHRNKSADFGRSYPPPPPGPPPRSPLSPVSPASQRPTVGDPLRPFKDRAAEDAPYSEGDRLRTPYRTFSGEKTSFTSDGLRRSASNRDTTKLNPNGSPGRARSTSPSRNKTKQNIPRKPFVEYSSSDEQSSDDPDTTHTSEEFEAKSAPNAKPDNAPPNRPKKYPTPPSRKLNGSPSPYIPPSAQSDGEQSKSKSNMYDSPNLFSHITQQQFSSFDAAEWQRSMFGTTSTCGAGSKSSIPAWAVPSSVRPGGIKKSSTLARSTLPSRSPLRPRTALRCSPSPKSCLLANVDGHRFYTSPQDGDAYRNFESELERGYGRVTEELDRTVFFKLVQLIRTGKSSGNFVIDRMIRSTLALYPNVGVPFLQSDTDPKFFNNSFTFPVPPDMFTPNAKSRSEETINTTFSPEGWDGKFTGSGDYFDNAGSTNKATSPNGRSGVRSNNPYEPNGNQTMPPPPPPADASQSSSAYQNSTEETMYDQEHWEKTFKNSSWAWPPPPPNPPAGNKVSRGKTPSKKASKSSNKGAKHAQVTDDHDEDYEAQAPVTGDDAMDIDPTPLTQAAGKEARYYPTPNPALYKESQKQQTQAQGRKASNATPNDQRVTNDTGLATSLDDLANVEPIGRRPVSGNNGSGLKSFAADLGSNLPFQSQAASTLQNHPLEPIKLQMPPVPKAPEPPVKLSRQSWHSYTTTFGAYVQAFHVCNTRMLEHFSARERNAQMRMAGGMGWLEAAGDTSTHGGFDSYLRALKEDEQAREMWNMVSERHVDACRTFHTMRDRVKSLVTAGSLAEQ
ncbi:Hypothetical protein R9X50_00279700 [Acrodontium crateriforme]|uniref:J domain-containing protein n=1 Tax=Acrodontium crateriforme TaxID=150365 RepID=A0AAQ3M1R4_9PEZI|nr:Hypothetical protein R9X50_00279700 [Acrodontium crateriforme]